MAKLREQATATRVSCDLPQVADSCCIAIKRLLQAVGCSRGSVNRLQAEGAQQKVLGQKLAISVR